MLKQPFATTSSNLAAGKSWDSRVLWLTVASHLQRRAGYHCEPFCNITGWLQIKRVLSLASRIMLNSSRHANGRPISKTSTATVTAHDIFVWCSFWFFVSGSRAARLCQVLPAGRLTIQWTQNAINLQSPEGLSLCNASFFLKSSNQLYWKVIPSH